MNALVDLLLSEMSPHLGTPFALFGHSMGAAIAFELSQRLRKAGAALPTHLMVSGRRAPHVPDPGDPLHRLPDQEFLVKLRECYGTPDEVLRSRELQELVLPALRADLELLETWESPAHPPLPLPIVAFAGSRDAGVPVADVSGWRRHTEAAFELHIVEGDHMFLHGAQATLLSLVSAVLSS